jgi:hypothetical protein
MKEYLSRFPVEMMSRVLGVSRGGYYKQFKIKHLNGSCTELDKMT